MTDDFDIFVMLHNVYPDPVLNGITELHKIQKILSINREMYLFPHGLTNVERISAPLMMQYKNIVDICFFCKFSHE